jgi:phosphoglucosamine mutase
MPSKEIPDYFPLDWRFGTDGIRGSVETYMNPLFLVKLGWAAGKIFKETGLGNSVLIGKDTRISGYMIESALESGFISAGINVTLLGPMPTPGVAYLAKSTNQPGLVISASHNRFSDNGIKFFNQEGFKLEYMVEKRLEDILLEKNSVVDSLKLGKAIRLKDAQERYIDFCISSSSNLDLTGLTLVVDCANGANYSIAPKVFSELGCNVIEIGTSPDGININEDCGSTNPEKIQKEVISNGADLGIAFDGDGDRLVLVDRNGKILDGDDLLYALISTNISDPDKTPYQGIAGTLMTNKSLELFLEREGIEFLRTEVGDKYVLRALLERGWILGGEPSGHIICLDQTTTGDALIASVKVLKSLKSLDFDISKVLENFTKLPQELISFEVNNPHKIIMNSEVRSEVFKLEKKLGNKGRVLIRPSGTEDLLRVMVEASTKELAEGLALELSDFIRKAA